MSHHLPAHPSLEHLRKQAKELLPELRREKPAAKLADALHAVARAYGFRTWPQLKTGVAALRLQAERTAAPATSRSDGSPFVGSWKADLARSTRHPLNQYQAATIQFAVDGPIVTIDDVVVDESGRAEQTRNVIQADGQARPADHGHVVTARWLGARSLEALVTRDDRIEGRVLYEVSPDGRTLVLTAGEQVGVFGRCGAGT